MIHFLSLFLKTRKLKTKQKQHRNAFKVCLQTSMDFSLSWQEFVIAQNHHTVWHSRISLFEADGSTNATAVLELMTCRFVVNALIH